MLFIGVEVEQETSAPPPKKNPGSAPAYVKQTKALSLIWFCDTDKGKVLEALILKQVIQFQAS